MDARIYLWSKWSTLIDLSEKIGKNLAVEQTQYLRTLKKDIKVLVRDITDFRGDYEKNGPMVEGIVPKEAIERLKRFDEQYEVREHQFKINNKGEELFGLQHQKYPALEKTKAELSNLKKLYNLYS
jgi:dynein heavy chain, axonemal